MGVRGFIGERVVEELGILEGCAGALSGGVGCGVERAEGIGRRWWREVAGAPSRGSSSLFSATATC